jgi:Glycosyltransferase family 87
MYGVLLIAICLVQVRFVVAQGFGDWSSFWSAAATVGTPDLLDPHRHILWQRLHHIPTTIFPYLPATAWLLLPFKFVPLGVGYALNFVVMAAATIAAGIIASRIYRVQGSIASILLFAWAPVIAALSTAQNSPIGMLLEFAAILGIVGNSAAIAGLAVGLLLYKVTYAAPFVVFFLVRRNMRALVIVVLCAALWYLLSVAATAGDWGWPSRYVAALQGYFGPDARYNAAKAISVPSLLMRFDISGTVAILLGLALFGLAVPLLIRMPLLEAASFTPLAALAASPHVLPYDLALAAPALFYIMTHTAEPFRTRLVCAVYVIAPLWLLSGVLHFDILAIVCDGLAVAWIAKGYNESTSGTHFDIADPRDRSKA